MDDKLLYTVFICMVMLMASSIILLPEFSQKPELQGFKIFPNQEYHHKSNIFAQKNYDQELLEQSRWVGFEQPAFALTYMNEAPQYIASMNKGQQNFYVENNIFTQDINQLGIGIETETPTYYYFIRLIDDAIFNYGIAKNPQETQSYLGIVYQQSGGRITSSLICQIQVRGLTQFNPIKNPDGSWSCGDYAEDLSQKKACRY